MRFAIWTAVSTAEQARPEKYSLETQLDRCRAAGQALGWVESAVYTVSGQSRTKYIQLDQAAAEIEPLRRMLADARAGRFDILVMTEFDRLRELLDQVFRTLAAYQVQLYSLAQPIDPVPPSEYTIYKSDTVALLIGMSQILSRQDVARTRRKWTDNLPKRITELGLPPTSLPYGYTKPAGHEYDRKAVPVPVPEIAAVLVQLKDLHLAGKSSTQLREFMERSGLTPPKGARWHAQTIRDLLRNPFYAGQVQFGKSRVVHDPLTGKRTRDRTRNPERLLTNTGRHTPLWDDATHQAILAEFKRRTKSYRGRVNNQFTGLVKCGLCGLSMWRQGNGPRAFRLIWRCSSNQCHNAMPHTILLEKVGAELDAQIRGKLAAPPQPAAPAPAAPASDPSQSLTRLEDAYLAGSFDLPTYTRRRAELLTQIETARAAQEQKTALETQRRLTRQKLATLAKQTSLLAWLTATDPATVNLTLHTLLKSITVGRAVSIEFK